MWQKPFIILNQIVGLKFTFFFPFYVCKCLCVMPVKNIYSEKHKQHSSKVFEISFLGAMSSLVALTLATIYIYDTFKQLRSCAVNNNCPSSYIGLTDACYAFTLLLVVLFVIPHQLCNILNDSYHNYIYTINNITNKFQIETFRKVITIYCFMAVEILRKFISEPPNTNFDDIVLWIFMQLIKNIEYSIDALIISLFAILEMNLCCVNTKLVEVLHSNNDMIAHVDYLSEIQWHFSTVVIKCNNSIGFLLLVMSVYKQLQVIGMIYFTLLSNLQDNGNDIYQTLDVLLPTINFVWVCMSASSLATEAKRCMFIFQDLSLSICDNFKFQNKVAFFQSLNHYRKIELSANNFFVVRLGLFIKVCSVALTYIVAVQQLKPMPSTNTTA